MNKEGDVQGREFSVLLSATLIGVVDERTEGEAIIRVAIDLRSSSQE